MITLDTSAILAALNRDDPDHRRAYDVLDAERGPLVVPVGILAEAGYMIRAVLGATVLRRFVSDLEARYYELDCGERDMGRVGELLERYDDLRLGIADACVAACAERRGGRVLTFDERDFLPLAREGIVQVVPGPS